MILKKKPPLLLTVGTAVLLIGGGAIAYWGATRQSELSKDLPVGANVIPQEVLMTVTFTTDEGQWRKLRQFGAPETQIEFDANLARWRDRLLTDNGYNFKRDIQPWVGEEITLAFLPEQSGQEDETSALNNPLSSIENGLGNPQRPVMLALPIANPEKAQEILAKPKDPAVSWVGRNYKGVQIQEIQTRSDNRLAAAVLGSELLVVANHTQLAELAVDTYKGAKPVMQTPGYSKAFRQVATSQVFAKLYINIPRAVDALSPDSELQPPRSSLNQFQANQGLTATITLEPNGIQFQGTSWLASGSDRTYQVSNDAGQLPRRLPANTLMMVSGGNLQRLWQDYSQEAENGSLLPLSPDNLRVAIQSYTGLDLDDDLIPWMEGEFTLALVAPNPLEKMAASSPSEPINLLPGLLFMVQVSDRATAEKKLAQLDEVLASRHRYQVNTAQVANQAVIRWVSPMGSTTITHGWLDNNVVFLALGKPVVEAIVPRPDRSLAETSLFQATTRLGSNPNNGHFFLNLNQLNAIEGTNLLPELPANGKKITAAIQAIGVTAAIQNERSTRYDIFVALPKGKRPGALPSPERLQEEDKSSEKEAPEE